LKTLFQKLIKFNAKPCEVEKAGVNIKFWLLG